MRSTSDIIRKAEIEKGEFGILHTMSWLVILLSATTGAVVYFALPSMVEKTGIADCKIAGLATMAFTLFVFWTSTRIITVENIKRIKGERII